MESSTDMRQDDLRSAAVTRVRKKQDFRAHVLAYVLVNAFLVGIWAVTGADFFWPVFPILGWGIGVAFNAWDVYGRKPLSEDQIQEEMRRMRRG
jgi:2TM domain